MHKKRKVLILGGSGLLGSSLIQELLAIQTVAITATYRNTQLKLPGVEWIPFDAHMKDMNALLNTHYDLIINCIGLVNLDFCEANPSIAAFVNTEIPVTLARQLALSHRRFVHISTDGLFGKGMGPFDEFAMVNPINVYAKTKADADKAILEENPDAIVLRLSFLVRSTLHPQRGLINRVIEDIVSGKTLRSIPDWYFNPIFIKHLALFLFGLMNDTVPVKGIYHLYSHEAVSKGEIIKRFNQIDLDMEQSILEKYKHSIIEEMSLSRCEFAAKRPQSQVLISKRLHEIPFFHPPLLFVGKS